jgi:hypothetical protein
LSEGSGGAKIEYEPSTGCIKVGGAGLQPFGYAPPTMSEQEDTVAAACASVRRRLQNGPNEFAAARSIRLPADKAAFPKLVVLDTNHWIALARVHHGRSQDAVAVDALVALRAATKERRILIPITDINLGEASGSENEDRRKRLAEFMVDLSGNFSLSSHLHAAPIEIGNAIASVYQHGTLSVPARTQLIRWGVLHAVGVHPVTAGNPQIDQFLNDVLDYPEVSVSAMVHAANRDLLYKINRAEAEAMRRADAIRQLDQQMDVEQRHRLELSNLNTDVLDRLLQALGIDATVFHAWLGADDHCARFWHAVPGIDVLLTLFLERDRSLDAKTHRNDGRDLSLLKIAVPYANIVMSERLWAHLTNKTGLATKYGTEVTADLRQLPDLLKKQGCL